MFGNIDVVGADGLCTPGPALSQKLLLLRLLPQPGMPCYSSDCSDEDETLCDCEPDEARPVLCSGIKPLNSQPVFSKLIDQVARLAPNQPDCLINCRQPNLIMSLSNQSMVGRIDEIILLKKHVVGPF
jgi:hypothetical protein